MIEPIPMNDPNRTSRFIYLDGPSTQNTLSKSRLMIITILSVLLMVTLGLVGYFTYQNYQRKQQLYQIVSVPTVTPGLTQEPNDSVTTATWKIFTNSQYGYSVKHPSYLTPIKITDNDIDLSYISFRDPSDKQKMWFSVTVSEANLDEQVKFEKWTEEHVLTSLVNEVKITKDGHLGVRLDYEPERPDNGDPMSHIIIYNGRYSYTLNAKTNTIDRIFSTFKFLD